MKTTLSETRFDRYLVEHGYDPGDPEPDLGVEKHPDRLIERDGVRVVCEVKEFTTSPLAKAGRGPRSFSSKEWYKPVRKTVETAAGQLRPLKDSGLPLVVVISNPRGVPVPLETEDVIHALYGDPTYTFTIDTARGGPVGGVNFGAGRNGRLTNYHPYISGVVILRERAHEQDFAEELSARLRGDRGDAKTYEEAIERATEFAEALDAARERGEVPEGDYRYVDVITTMSDQAVALPGNVFDGPKDSRWEFDAHGGGYVGVR